MTRRFRKNIPLSRARQYYITGISLSYAEQPENVQRRIDALCMKCCPEHYEAFRRYVTREESATPAMMEGFIASGTTLYRAIRKYFLEFDIEVN